MPNGITRTVSVQRKLASVVHEVIAKRHIDKIHKEAKEKYKRWMEREGIDWKLSTDLVRNKSRELDAVQKHAAKHRRDMFSDKVSIFTRQDMREWNRYWVRVYHGVRVRDQYCESCRNLINQPVVEERNHYLLCRAHRRRRRNITTDIKTYLEENTTVPIPEELPCYWNEDEKNPRTNNALRKKIEEYGPMDAACGLIPEKWVEWLRQLAWKQDASAEQAARHIQICILRGYFDCWKMRCRLLFALNRPGPLPPRPAVRRPRRSIRDED